MANHVQLYNNLPSLQEAQARFHNRQEIFEKLSPLLTRFSNKYGVCLVHRHCILDEGEKMVATGNVTQPQRDIEVHPLRWLATGEPFEFTTDVTEPPPRELLESFQQIVGNQNILGLFYVHERDRTGGVLAERTEGRKNIVQIIPQPNSNSIVTGWINGQNGLVALLTCPGDIHSGDIHWSKEPST